MAQFYQNIGHIILMLMLLCCSAFFSGAETAFFSLSRKQVNLLKASKHKLLNLTSRLITTPRELLGCFLFGNMLVNTLFFAISSVLIIRIERQIGVTAAVVTAFLTLSSLIIFGEIIPKTTAYAHARAVSTVFVLPTYFFLQLFTPIISIFRIIMVEPALRLILGPVRQRKPITTTEFKSLMHASRKQGLISTEENRLLSEIIDLRLLKVRDCIRPRVDMTACNVRATNEEVRKLMRQNHLTKIPAYVNTIDNIIGQLHLRHLLLQPDKSADKLVQKIDFVPEQKTIESLLEFFRKAHTDTAIVVDEYGGIAGLISLEDIAEELLGPIEFTDKLDSIEPIGPFQYRLAGDLNIHDWAEAFDIEPGETQISTIGGFVTALLGKIPKAGDEAHLRNIRFTVEKMQKHRVESLILTIEPLGQND